VTGQRTGCGIIYNTTSVHFNVFDPPSRDGRGVDPGGNATFECKPIFWECHDEAAIQGYAFQFRSVGPDGISQDQFYMFVDENGILKWVRMAAPWYLRRHPVYYEGTDTRVGERLWCVNVSLNEIIDPVVGQYPFRPTIFKVW